MSSYVYESVKLVIEIPTGLPEAPGNEELIDFLSSSDACYDHVNTRNAHVDYDVLTLRFPDERPEEVLECIAQEIGEIDRTTGAVRGIDGMLDYRADEGIVAECVEIENGRLIASRAVSRIEPCDSDRTWLGKPCAETADLDRGDVYGHWRKLREADTPVIMISLEDLRGWYESVVGRPAEHEELELIAAAFDAEFGGEDVKRAFLREHSLIAAAALKGYERGSDTPQEHRRASAYHKLAR